MKDRTKLVEYVVTIYANDERSIERQVNMCNELFLVCMNSIIRDQLVNKIPVLIGCEVTVKEKD